MSDYAVYIPILKRLRVKMTRGTKKSEISKLGEWTLAAIIIQRAFRSKMVTSNKVCPIEMTDIRWPFVSFETSPGCYLRMSLGGYAGMLASGTKMINPLSRQFLAYAPMDQARDMVYLYLERVIPDKYGELPITYIPRMYTSFESNNVQDLLKIVKDTAASAREYNARLAQDSESASFKYQAYYQAVARMRKTALSLTLNDEQIMIASSPYVRLSQLEKIVYLMQ